MPCRHNDKPREIDRHQTEEHHDEHIAQALGGKKRGVEKGEHHTQGAHPHQVPAPVSDERQAHHAGRNRCDGQCPAHGRQRDPSLGTRPFGSQAGLAIVVSTHEVEVIVDQIGVDLHQPSEQQAQEGWHNLKLPPPYRLEGQCKPDDDGHGSSRQSLGPRGKQPSLHAVGLNGIVF